MFVFGWLTIVMGCWIWHGTCTLWHDSVLWKTTNRWGHRWCSVELDVFVNTSANCFSTVPCSVLHETLCFFFSSGFVGEFFCILYQCDTLDELSSCCLGHFGRIQSVCTKHQWRWFSSAFFGQPHPATRDGQQFVHKYTKRYSYCINTVDIQGVDLPPPWCWAPGQLCAAPVGVSPLSPMGKHATTSQSAPAKDTH